MVCSKCSVFGMSDLRLRPPCRFRLRARGVNMAGGYDPTPAPVVTAPGTTDLFGPTGMTRQPNWRGGGSETSFWEGGKWRHLL